MRIGKKKRWQRNMTSTDYKMPDKKTEDATYFIDVKSEGLRDILKSIMQDVEGTCLKEDKPTVYYPPSPRIRYLRSAANLGSG
jgi:hypothetical protein